MPSFEVLDRQFDGFPGFGLQHESSNGVEIIAIRRAAAAYGRPEHARRGSAHECSRCVPPPPHTEKLSFPSAPCRPNA